MKKDQIIRTQNVQRQEVCWFIKPPINGPKLGPIYIREILAYCFFLLLFYIYIRSGFVFLTKGDAV